MDRRDFLKKTGGAAASTTMPGLGKAAQIATQITKTITQGFTLSPEFLAKYIQKVADIPIMVLYDYSDTPKDGKPQEDFTIDVNALMKYMGINPEWKASPQGHRTNEMTLDPQDVFNKVYKSTGDKNLVDQMEKAYTEQLKIEKHPGNAIYTVLWKYLGTSVTANIAKAALGQLIKQKGYSTVQIGKHAKKLGQHSVEILKGIIKYEGGAQNIFKTDIRELKKTWQVLPDAVKEGMNWNSIEDLEAYYSHMDLSDLVDFPNAAKILNLPDWLIKSVQKSYVPELEEYRLNKDVKDYMKDYLKTNRTQADQNLTKKFKPKTQTLGHWNKEAKNLNALNPGQNLGFYTTEHIHCHTPAYKTLTETNQNLQILYHTTHKKNLKTIMKHGLNPQKTEWEEDEKHYNQQPPHKFIYLTPRKETSQGFAPHKMGRGTQEDTITLKITLPPQLQKQLILDRGEFIRAPFTIPPKYIQNTQPIKESLDNTTWEAENGQQITLTQLLNATKNYPTYNIPTSSIEKIIIRKTSGGIESDRLKTADTQYPILIVVDDHNNLKYVLDGNHRANKAIDAGHKTIPAKLINIKKLPQEFQDVLGS